MQVEKRSNMVAASAGSLTAETCWTRQENWDRVSSTSIQHDLAQIERAATIGKACQKVLPEKCSLLICRCHKKKLFIYTILSLNPVLRIGSSDKKLERLFLNRLNCRSPMLETPWKWYFHVNSFANSNRLPMLFCWAAFRAMLLFPLTSCHLSLPQSISYGPMWSHPRCNRRGGLTGTIGFQLLTLGRLHNTLVLPAWSVRRPGFHVGFLRKMENHQLKSNQPKMDIHWVWPHPRIPVANEGLGWNPRA